MLNNQIYLDAINILKALSYSQLQIDDDKRSILVSGYFNDQKMYQQIDRKLIQKVYCSDLTQFLSVHRIAATERQCQYLISISGSKQAFMTIENFRNYLGIQKDKNLNNSSLYGGNVGDELVKSYSERQLAKLYQKQINYYRTIQALKEELIKKYGFNFKNIVHKIDTQSKGNIDFNSLIDFIHFHGVEFSDEEFKALCKRIQSKNTDFLTYKELIRAFAPFQPLSYPIYRKQNNMSKAINYITQQLNKLQISSNFLPFNQPGNDTKKMQTGFQKTIEQYRSSPTKGKHLTSNYFYDKNYYNELRQYKTGFFDPNKNVKEKVQNSMIGPQYHDHFFSDYYLYLEERNKSEYYYNKFGKRYTYENPILKYDKFSKKQI